MPQLQNQIAAINRTGARERSDGRPYAFILQLLWFAVMFTSLGLFVTSVGPRYMHLSQAALRYERVLNDLQVSPASYALYLSALDTVVVLIHILIAAVIFWHAHESNLAVLVSLTLVVTPLTAMDALRGDSPLQGLASAGIYSLGLAASISLLYLFPDGRFVPSWTRLLALMWALLNIQAVFSPQSAFGLTASPPAVQLAVLSLWSASGVYAQIFRYFRVSSAQQRRQTRWAILGLTAAILGPFGYYTRVLTLPSLSQGDTTTIFYNLADPALFRFAFLSQMAGVSIYALGLLVFPLSLAIAVMRHHLFDIRLVANRTLVYGGLTAAIIALYALVVGALGTLLQAQGNAYLAIIATGLIAVLFQPLRQKLQRVVNRIMYGDRDDPGAVLHRLGAHMEQTAAPEAMLTAMVEAVAQALRLPYVALFPATTTPIQENGSAIAVYGPPIERAFSFPLSYQGRQVGSLVAAPRSAGEAFSRAEQRLLETIARQAGAAVYAYQLTGQLRSSRQQLVRAREEERRRLRRDLHDGLGPQLALLTLKVDAVRNNLRQGPEGVDAMLMELRKQAQSALQDVRRLAYDLRPPALDQLGLAPAIAEYASKHSTNGLSIRVEIAEPLPSLPAAVEVAAYRIALEAITNVTRHARAANCTVRIGVAAGLQLQIDDDGEGLSAAMTPGVGLASMRERADELGGVFELNSTPGLGTQVSVRLPLVNASD